MEKRFGDMMHKNSQRRYLPKSLTEEILNYRQKVNEGKIREQIGEEGSDAPSAEGREQEESSAP